MFKIPFAEKKTLPNLKNTYKEVDQRLIKEARKRLIFIIKLATFFLLMFIQVRFPNFGEGLGVPLRVLDAILYYYTAHLIISFTRILTVYLYLNRRKLDKEIKDNFVIGINTIAQIIQVVALLIAILPIFNLDFAGLFTSISIVAAAIALLSKDYISNMINGMILMFSNQISLGDYVKIGSHKGKIEDLTLINVHLVNDDEDLIYIPNNLVFATDVVNYTKRKVKKISVDFDLPLSVHMSTSEVEEILKNSLEPYKNAIREESFILKIYSIQKDGIQYKFQFILIKENKEVEKEIRRFINRTVVDMIVSYKDDGQG
jgi:small-conductance mechanosensitive channel